MKRDPNERLAQEALTDPALEQLRQSSLATGVKIFRRRRRARAMVMSGSVVLAAVAAVVVARRNSEYLPPRPAAAASVNTPRHVSYVNDAELLSLFPHRPVALVGNPGEQQLVFIDRTTTTDSPHEGSSSK